MKHFQEETELDNQVTKEQIFIKDAKIQLEMEDNAFIGLMT